MANIPERRPECKLIEKGLKELIFKQAVVLEEQSIPTNTDKELNSNFHYVANIEKKNDTVESAEILFEPSPPLSSSLIDFKVLTDFAAKNMISTASDPLESAKLPHPEDSPPPKNGELQEGIAVLLNSIAKNSTNIPDIKEIKQNAIHYEETDDVTQSPNKSRDTPKKRKSKQLAKKKAKEKQQQPFSPTQDPVENSPSKNFNEERNRTPRNKKKRYVIKGKKEEEECIEMKQNAFASIGKEYTLNFELDHFKLNCHICKYSTEQQKSMKNHLNSHNHLKEKELNDADLWLSFIPDLLPAQEEAITERVMKEAELYGLREEDIEIRQAIFLKLETYIKDKLPDSCSIDMIGSSATGFGLKLSNVDFTLSCKNEDDLPDHLETLHHKMSVDTTFDNVVNDFKTKVPRIMFVDRHSKLSCSIWIEGAASLKQTYLISTYRKLDPRVPVLGNIVRIWAKLCGIDQPQSGTLPSIAYVICLIYFLQQVSPPVLPVLHEDRLCNMPTKENCEQIIEDRKWKSENTDSIGALFVKFLRYFNFSYIIGENVVNIRYSKVYASAQKMYKTRFYAIEEPITKRNLAYTIPTFDTCRFIQRCFLRSYRYFAYAQLKESLINAGCYVKLQKPSNFDDLSTFEYFSEMARPESEDTTEEIVDDELSDNDELEDHDPDVPVENFISTMTNLSLDETEVKSVIEPLEKKSSVTEGSPSKKAPPKENNNKIALKLTWDSGGHNFTKDSFHYSFNSSTFAGDKPVPIFCKNCKSFDHLQKDCPGNEIPKPKKMPQVSGEQMKFISAALLSVYESNAVYKYEFDQADRLMKDLENHIKSTFPTAKLRLFGSFCNGFGFRSQSDMDMCLTFSDKDDKQKIESIEIIETLARELQKYPKLHNILAVTSAKVPIVKFAWKAPRLEGDISLYNLLAIHNTEMLELYTKIDSRVQILGYALKYFAKVVGICDASKGSLSSYAYILMVIFFLQQRDPPVIPVLQELYTGEKPINNIEGWNVWFYNDLEKLKEVWPEHGKNSETVGELWVGMMNFYCCHFDWQEFVISIKQKKLLTKFRKRWGSNRLAIEDPFDLNHNLGSGLTFKMHAYIMKAFFRARERSCTTLSFNGLNDLRREEMNYLFNRNFLNNGVEPPHDRGCRNCGKIGHMARSCPEDKSCSYCRKVGHLVANCPQKSRQRNEPEKSKDSQSRQNFPHAYHVLSTVHHSRPPNKLPQQAHIPNMHQLLLQGIPTHRMMAPPGLHSVPRIPPGFPPNVRQATKHPFAAGSPPKASSIQQGHAGNFPRGRMRMANTAFYTRPFAAADAGFGPPMHGDHLRRYH